MEESLGSAEEAEPLSILTPNFNLNSGALRSNSRNCFSLHTNKNAGLKSEGISATSHLLTENPLTRDFRNRFFPNVTQNEWHDWKWQLRHRITHLSELEKLLCLSEEERNALTDTKNNLPLAITPYYAGLLDRRDALQALRRTDTTLGSCSSFEMIVLSVGRSPTSTLMSMMTCNDCRSE